MECRKFNSIMPIVNEIWASKVLNMELNLGKGPDLFDDKKFVEVKFSLINPKQGEGNYPKSWTVQNHQPKYSKDPRYIEKEGFWGLGLYELDRSVRDIKTTDRQELEQMVLSRELTVIKWDWMKQFPVHRVNGKTKRSEWENYFRYPKASKIPEISHKYNLEKGIVYFTAGVNPGMFNLS